MRYRFGTTVCEIHTTRDRDRARAISYVVQERSVALQPCAHVAPCEAGSEDDARAMAARLLEEYFGPQTCKSAVVPDQTGYRILDGPRSA